MNLKMFKMNSGALPVRHGRVALLLGIFLLVMSPGLVLAQEVPVGCGSLREPGQFGPFDYRAEKYEPEPVYRSHKALLYMVENAHFTPQVEALVRGKTSARPGHDIAYTLHAFPNHHRALMAMVALGKKEKTNRPSDTPFSIECWFIRAVTWRPDDTIVRLIYATYLNDEKRTSEAEQQLSFAASQAKENAFTQHNIGLVYFDMKNYDKALMHAHKAYALGLGIPTLRDQLKSVGKWSEPAESPPAEADKHPK